MGKESGSADRRNESERERHCLRLWTPLGTLRSPSDCSLPRRLEPNRWTSTDRVYAKSKSIAVESLILTLNQARTYLLSGRRHSCFHPCHLRSGKSPVTARAQPTDLTDVTTTLAYENLGKTVNFPARFSMSPARGLSLSCGSSVVVLCIQW
jgi:hypothetical protein